MPQPVGKDDLLLDGQRLDSAISNLVNPQGRTLSVLEDHQIETIATQMADSLVKPGLIASYSSKSSRIVARHRRNAIAVGISLVISAALFVFFTTYAGMGRDSIFFWLFIASFAVSVFRLLWTIGQGVIAYRQIKGYGTRLALQIRPDGVVIDNCLQGTFIPWEDIISISGRSRIVQPLGPLLEIRWGSDLRWMLPFAVMDIDAAQIDCAIRSFSSGRFGIDSSRLDEIW